MITSVYGDDFIMAALDVNTIGAGRSPGIRYNMNGSMEKGVERYDELANI